MRAPLIIIIILTIFSCKEKKQDLSSLPIDTTVKVIPNEDTIFDKKVRPQAGLILSNENVKIFGDTTIDKEKIYFTSVKFEPYISFEDFKVEEIDTIKAVLNLSSNEDAYRFRTRIRAAYKEKIANFAGHYTFAWWGCGSPCQSGVVIDRKTGQIYDAPPAALGYDFKSNSKMMIVNPPDSLGFYDECFYCKPVVYVFDEQTKKFMERHPR